MLLNSCWLSNTHIAVCAVLPLPALLLVPLLAHRRMLLVQAVSQHRQRRPGDSVTSLLNLISAYRAQPEEGAAGGSVGVVQWGEREELKELYGLFTAKVSTAWWSLLFCRGSAQQSKLVSPLPTSDFGTTCLLGLHAFAISPCVG